MNKRIKKIIAREFLVFLALVIIGGIIVLCVFPYNAIKQNKVDKLDLNIVQLENEIDSLGGNAIKKQKKQEWYYSKLSSEFDVEKPPYDKLSTFWERLEKHAKQDSLKYKWIDKWSDKVQEFHSELDFKNGNQFQDFVLNNSLTKSDSLDLKKTEKLKSELEKITEDRNETKWDKVSENHHLDIAGGVFIFLFIIMFILRYIYYAIKWSFRTLKNE